VPRMPSVESTTVRSMSSRTESKESVVLAGPLFVDLASPRRESARDSHAG
jgi:hypothetical protein